MQAANPFENPMGAPSGASRTGWIISGGMKSEFDNIFEGLKGAASGKVSGAVVAPELRRHAPSLDTVGMNANSLPAYSTTIHNATK